MKIGLILGDQLSFSLPTLSVLNKQTDILVMAEVKQEATYVKHHKQKIALIFSAMRHHAEELRDAGWSLAYFKYDEHSFDGLFDVVSLLSKKHKPDALVITSCGEYRLQSQIENEWPKALEHPIELLEDTRFICSQEEFNLWARGKKQLRMEFFYREMRRKTGLLMELESKDAIKKQPIGGKWNFDSSNRRAYRKKDEEASPIPKGIQFARDVIDQEVLLLVKTKFKSHIGELEPFLWATSREDAEEVVEYFVTERLPFYGDFQDALVMAEDYLFHSLISPYINLGLLDPLAVCQRIEQAYFDGVAPLNAVEGFIRQIIGWREYVRGIYWLNMPEYATYNSRNNETKLPSYYWDGGTKMKCMSEALRNTLENGYAHHIQRLMITGNFALLIDAIPEEICEWYLSVYVDAFDWVELPNTLGMVMHADGGYLGSKPYAASGSYINKMSDYCKHCEYNVKTAVEEDSCPFNALYWGFIERHREHFHKNPRMAMIYRTYEKMDESKRIALKARSTHLIDCLEEL